MPFYSLHFTPAEDGTSGGTAGKIISATNTGDNQHYILSDVATSEEYTAIINNGIYTVDDTNYPFTVSSLSLVFNSPLPADLAGTIIRLQCV
jgi:hypothetical protein